MEFQLVPEKHLSLTDLDLIDLKDLKVRQLEHFSDNHKKKIALSLVDILFAFLYDLRTTGAEGTCESGWTIAKLSPSLTFFVQWHDTYEAIHASVRRSLCYPLYRNLTLAQHVLEDLVIAFEIGRPALLHSLLSIRRIFNSSGEFRYLFNQLLIDDLCLWVQSIEDKFLVELATNVCSHVRPPGSMFAIKTSLAAAGLDLDSIETEARLSVLRLNGDDTENLIETSASQIHSASTTNGVGEEKKPQQTLVVDSDDE